MQDLDPDALLVTTVYLALFALMHGESLPVYTTKVCSAWYTVTQQGGSSSAQKCPVQGRPSKRYVCCPRSPDDRDFVLHISRIYSRPSEASDWLISISREGLIVCIDFPMFKPVTSKVVCRLEARPLS